VAKKIPEIKQEGFKKTRFKDPKLDGYKKIRKLLVKLLLKRTFYYKEGQSKLYYTTRARWIPVIIALPIVMTYMLLRAVVLSIAKLFKELAPVIIEPYQTVRGNIKDAKKLSGLEFKEDKFIKIYKK
jgi:hypothetical protein